VGVGPPSPHNFMEPKPTKAPGGGHGLELGWPCASGPPVVFDPRVPLGWGEGSPLAGGVMNFDRRSVGSAAAQPNK